MSKYLLICMLILQSISGNGQVVEWMDPPVKHTVRLAGTFGELRTNHFHTGVDIKSSNGKIGDKIYAVADGFVSRIKISSTGYGNALYIDHPNGKTTVYGHMNSFIDTFEQVVNSIQYGSQSFEIDSSFVADQLPVTRGQWIGIMGNSGRSYGPHLHFEIRDTKTEIALNPLANGVVITDILAPAVDYLMIHTLDDQHLTIASEKIILTKSGNEYKPATSTIKIPAWRVGLAVFTRDLMSGVSNKNGLYSAMLKVDGVEAYSFEMDSISFDHFRYLNAHIDYAHYKKTKHKLHQLYRKKGNKIPIYRESDEQFIKLYNNKPREIEIVLSDFHNNVSTIRFSMIRDTNMHSLPSRTFQYFLPYNDAHIISREDVKMKFDEGSFYEDYYMTVESVNEKEKNYQSEVYHIGEKETAIHRPFDLYIRCNIDSALMSKVTVSSCDDGEYSSYGGESMGDLIGAKVKTLGAYVLLLDTVPPVIKPISVPQEIKKGMKLKFQIDDNLQVKGQAKDPIYRATLDGKWILMTYDMKLKTLSHLVDESWPSGEHVLRLSVADDRGNESIWEKKLAKK